MIKVTIYEDRCKGCGLCIRACPKAVLAIAMSHLNTQGYYPVEVVDQASCIACASCAKTCPDVAIGIEK